MMLLWIAVALAAVDSLVTSQRISLHPSLELNPLVRWLESHLGATIASLVGVLLIQSLIAYLLLMWSPIAVAIMVGASLYRTYTQFLSLRYF